MCTVYTLTSIDMIPICCYFACTDDSKECDIVVVNWNILLLSKTTLFISIISNMKQYHFIKRYCDFKLWYWKRKRRRDKKLMDCQAIGYSSLTEPIAQSTGPLLHRCPLLRSEALEARPPGALYTCGLTAVVQVGGPYSFQSSALFSPLSLSLWRPDISSSALSVRRLDQTTQLLSCCSLNHNSYSSQRRRNTPRWWMSTKVEE